MPPRKSDRPTPGRTKRQTTNDKSKKPDPAFEAEFRLRAGGPLCGIDEAGRGPWAGPVVAAAVILDPENIPAGLTDSKLLSESARIALFDVIVATSSVGIAFASVARIDGTDIRKATLWAMARAVQALAVQPTLAIVDGRDVPPGLPCPATAIIDGDALSLSIAAASIIAKVTRDRMMCALDETTPGYEFSRHKGYGTALHQSALIERGVSAHHRRTFAPIRKLLSPE